jgi:hypothetical protein
MRAQYHFILLADYDDEPVEVPAGTLEMYANGAPQGEQNEVDRSSKMSCRHC